MISVTVLGSGTCVPSLQRSSCSMLMETGEAKLLFDCGAGTIRRLLEAGHMITEIDYLFFSHLHPDHTGELVSFLFSTKYAGWSRARKTPLTIVGGKGFVDFYDGLRKVYGEWIEWDEELLKILEMDNGAEDRAAFEGFSVKTLPMRHTEQSLAYRISDNTGRSAVYSGDTDRNENLSLLAKDADLLICECAHPDGLKVEGHLTPSLAGEMATWANVKNLMLIHFYPECDGVDMVGQCRKTYSGPLYLAQDLMQLKI